MRSFRKLNAHETMTVPTIKPVSISSAAVRVRKRTYVPPMLIVMSSCIVPFVYATTVTQETVSLDAIRLAVAAIRNVLQHRRASTKSALTLVSAFNVARMLSADQQATIEQNAIAWMVIAAIRSCVAIVQSVSTTLTVLTIWLVRTKSVRTLAIVESVPTVGYTIIEACVNARPDTLVMPTNCAQEVSLFEDMNGENGSDLKCVYVFQLR